jgi:glycosyltransferase involved in cell wall biosynthesis
MRKYSFKKPAKPFQKEILLTVVVPVYNEQEVILEFNRRLCAALEVADIDRAEIIYVNDGSHDNTLPLLLDLMEKDQRIEVLDLSRNFGKEAAMTAGLDRACGDAVVVIDADLQDPPELIPDMVSEWRRGYDVVYMRRLSREGETWLKKATARAFYALMARIGRVEMPENVGDFRLLSRRAVDALKQLPERTRFMKGLFSWIGFPAKELPYRRDPRYAGITKWNYWGLWNFAIEGITSFTIAPLKIASYIGFLTSGGALFYGLVVLGKALFFGNPVAGYPSMMVVILFLGGLQLLAVGVVGEYVGRMFIETKQRPIYLVNCHHQSSVERIIPRSFDLTPQKNEALS